MWIDALLGSGRKEEACRRAEVFRRTYPMVVAQGGLWHESLAHGARWMVLEHDKPKDPVHFARTSREYLLGLPA